jgi:hypothetical protein
MTAAARNTPVVAKGKKGCVRLATSKCAKLPLSTTEKPTVSVMVVPVSKRAYCPVRTKAPEPTPEPKWVNQGEAMVERVISLGHG